MARAEYTRRTAALEAQAKPDAAAKFAEAELARARGVAQANQIIGESLKGNEAYLRYLWIDKLDASKGQVVYVPTEGGLPILEAGKRTSHPQTSRLKNSTATPAIPGNLPGSVSG